MGLWWWLCGLWWDITFPHRCMFCMKFMGLRNRMWAPFSDPMDNIKIHKTCRARYYGAAVGEDWK